MFQHEQLILFNLRRLLLQLQPNFLAGTTVWSRFLPLVSTSFTWTHLELDWKTQLTEPVDNQLCDIGYAGWPMFSSVKPGSPKRARLSQTGPWQSSVHSSYLYCTCLNFCLKLSNPSSLYCMSPSEDWDHCSVHTISVVDVIFCPSCHFFLFRFLLWLWWIFHKSWHLILVCFATPPTHTHTCSVWSLPSVLSQAAVKSIQHTLSVYKPSAVSLLSVCPCTLISTQCRLCFKTLRLFGKHW